jgi:hypothetical protein
MSAGWCAEQSSHENVIPVDRADCRPFARARAALSASRRIEEIRLIGLIHFYAFRLLRSSIVVARG